MKSVSILCTDPTHPVNPSLADWARAHSAQARTRIHRHSDELTGGDILFLVSCHQIIRQPVRQLFRHTLVLHASALPEGRGMSPHIWQILQGADRLTVTLLDARDELDSGDIWHQIELRFDGTELHDEIHAKLFSAELALMSWALDHCDNATPRQQSGESSYFRKRSPQDSRIDPSRPLADSFDLLRVADPERYPAFFEHRGQTYRIRIDKLPRPS
jgi:methionyl-tRNA formyltransferase